MTSIRAVALVEGESDRVAVLALASELDRDLGAEGIEVVAMGGITNTRAFALRYGPRGLGVPLSGLYDAPDETKLREGLRQAGVEDTRHFFACTTDLEDELIRALGITEVEAVIEAEGETRSLELLAGMPAQAGWTREQVLRRFISVRSGRKARYAGLLVAALGPDRAPEPLRALVALL